MKKILIILIIAANLILPATNSQAQHEVSLYGLGGLPGLQLKTSSDLTTGKEFPGGFNIGYSYSLSPKWGIVSGIELVSYSSKVNATNITSRKESLYSYDGRSETMFFNSSVNGYEETQKATYLHIPLMAKFRLPALKSHEWYASAGAKFGFALSGKYESTANSIVTSGEFPETGLSFNDLPLHGFGTSNGVSWDGDLDFGFNAALSVETGIRWRLSDNWGLYTGVYLDYGLTDVSPAKTGNLIEYENTTTADPIVRNSAFTSKNQSGAAFVEKANLFSIGLKIGIGFRTTPAATAK
jgi:hypothetical protein